MVRTKLTLAFTALIFFFLLNWHCTKIDTTTLGGGLIPAVDNVNTFDTVLNIVANNFDSTSISGKGCTTIFPTDDHALGYISNDPYFGITKATIYTELKPGVFPFYFPANPTDRTLDSVVLVLRYTKAFGDSATPQSVTVNEVSPNNGLNFIPDSSTCTSYLVKPAILGSATYIPQRLRDTVRVFGDTMGTPIQLRIKLSASLGQKFLSQDSSATSFYNTDSSFRDAFKGFAISSGITGNGLSYFNLTDPITKLAIYYKYKRPGLTDTAVVTYFNLNFGNASANNILRTRGASEITNVSNANSNPAGDNFVYVQTSPGSYATLKIPGLPGLSNRIIHRAELIVDQVYSSSPLNQTFAPPDYLFLDLKDTGVNYLPVPCDFSAPGGTPDISTYGGYKRIATDAFGNTIARYTFNISRYVQKIVTNHRTSSVLRLSAPHYVATSLGYVDECGNGVAPLLFLLNNIASGSLKVGGKYSLPLSSNGIRLHIIYSKI
ncbi:MAG TPA: DUF4270 family protein [Chitinophagaceae bacterium]